MKILLVVDDYMPNSIKIGAKMMHELAVELYTKGHIVEVVTPKEHTSIEYLDNIKILGFKSGKIKNVNKIKRAINETLLSYLAWKSYKSYFKKSQFDLIIYYSPTIFFGPLVKKLKRLWNAKSYLILRDIFPQWVIDNGMLKENSLITKYFKYFEKINYNAADTIGLMSEKNLEWFKNYYENKNINLEILYNWVKVEPPKNKINKYRKKLNLEDKIIFFYGGNLGRAQDMLNIVRLAKNMRDIKEAFFVLVGEGDEKELIDSAIKNDNLDNIVLLPAVSQEEYKDMLLEFDIGLFTLSKHHKTHNFPGKLLGYMVNKMPILGSINPNNDLKELIEKHNAGLISINGNDDSFYNNALKLLDYDYREKLGNNAFKLVKNLFSVEHVVDTITRFNHTKG